MFPVKKLYLSGLIPRWSVEGGTAYIELPEPTRTGHLRGSRGLVPVAIVHTKVCLQTTAWVSILYYLLIPCCVQAWTGIGGENLESNN